MNPSLLALAREYLRAVADEKLATAEAKAEEKAPR